MTKLSGSSEIIDATATLLRIATWYSAQQDVPRTVWEALTTIEKDLSAREQAAKAREKERGY